MQHMPKPKNPLSVCLWVGKLPAQTLVDRTLDSPPPGLDDVGEIPYTDMSECARTFLYSSQADTQSCGFERVHKLKSTFTSACSRYLSKHT